jgi:ribosomal protein L40E
MLGRELGMTGIQCIGCDTPIPYGATKCPMCGAPAPAFSKQAQCIPEQQPNPPQHAHTAQPCKICPKCLMQVPIEALVCRYCREKIAYSKLEAYGTIFIAAVALIIFVIFLIPDNKSPESRQKTADQAKEDQEYNDKYEAKDRALFIVKGMLKSPSTAQFSDPTITKTANVFEVIGYVDSQNSFGAMLRTDFTVTFKKIGDKWDLVDIKI